MGLNQESRKALFAQFLAEYEVYSKGIKCLYGVMRILWNQSFSCYKKFRIDFANF